MHMGTDLFHHQKMWTLSPSHPYFYRLFLLFLSLPPSLLSSLLSSLPSSFVPSLPSSPLYLLMIILGDNEWWMWGDVVADVPSQKSSALGERVRESWGSFSVDIKGRIWRICVSMSLCRSRENPDICQIMLTPVEEPCLPITERVEISVSRNHTRPVWKVTECSSHECHMTHLIHTMDHH